MALGCMQCPKICPAEPWDLHIPITFLSLAWLGVSWGSLGSAAFLRTIRTVLFSQPSAGPGQEETLIFLHRLPRTAATDCYGNPGGCKAGESCLAGRLPQWEGVPQEEA